MAKKSNMDPELTEHQTFKAKLDSTYRTTNTSPIQIRKSGLTSGETESFSKPREKRKGRPWKKITRVKKSGKSQNGDESIIQAKRQIQIDEAKSPSRPSF